MLLHFETHKEAAEMLAREIRASSFIHQTVEDIMKRPLDADHQRIVDEAPKTLEPVTVLYLWYMEWYVATPDRLPSYPLGNTPLEIPPYSKRAMRTTFLHQFDDPKAAISLLMQLNTGQQDEIAAIRKEMEEIKAAVAKDK
jgi:hypothetical protein